MFNSSMQEGMYAKVHIPDAQDGAVEAALRFAYTSHLEPEPALLADVLVLAHTYDIDPLLRECCLSLTETVSGEVIIPILQALRPRRDNAHVEEAWGKIMATVYKDKAIIDKLCEEV